MAEAGTTVLTLQEAVPLAHAVVDRVASDHDVRVLFIKGPAAAMQSLRSERTSLDVDALVDPSRRHLLAAELTRLGWVDEHPYTSPTVLPQHSLTHRHRRWPCELDLHDRFPGFFADRQAVFEALWERRTTIPVAARELACPDVLGQALILALHSIRDSHDRAKHRDLDELVERLSELLTAEDRRALAELAHQLGASDTAAPFLDALGAPAVGRGSTTPTDLRAWRLRTHPADPTAVSWVEELRRRRKREWPRFLWYAATLSDTELRLAQPGLPPGRGALLQARVRRLRRGVGAVPAALRSIHQVDSEELGLEPGPVTTVAPPEPALPHVPPHQRRLLAAASRGGLGLLDRVVPGSGGVVVRTFPDFDDQGLAVTRALVESGVGPVTWLTQAGRVPGAAETPALDARVSVVRSRSLRGALAYARAGAVVHTHGLYQAPPRSPGKVFVNLWHGMPVKRLDPRPPVARRQTDLLTVTSQVHADHMARTWGIDPARVVRTGLPRNDRMLEASGRPLPEALTRITGGRPLVVWLPTYRQSVVGDVRLDGYEFGNDFEFAGANPATVGELAERLGVHIVLKLHPMAPTGGVGDFDHVSVWDEPALAATGLTLYELLGHADVLVTDHSSVWIDYLLLDRPVVFTIADLEEYAGSRGHYFAPLERHLPGPVVTDLAALRDALDATLAGDDPWRARRTELVDVHHAHRDAGSAQRVADLVVSRLTARRG